MSPADFKPYVDLFSALLTPVIAITTTYVAIQQYELAKERMRREQYDRRVAVYKGVMEVLSSIVTYGTVKQEYLSAWARATAEKNFLFKPDLCEHLDAVRKRIVEVWSLGAQLEILPEGQKKADLAGSRGEALISLAEQIRELPNRFAEYLRVSS
jgi:hypothetical protein